MHANIFILTRLLKYDVPVRRGRRTFKTVQAQCGDNLPAHGQFSHGKGLEWCDICATDSSFLSMFTRALHESAMGGWSFSRWEQVDKSIGGDCSRCFSADEMHADRNCARERIEICSSVRERLYRILAVFRKFQSKDKLKPHSTYVCLEMFYGSRFSHLYS